MTHVWPASLCVRNRKYFQDQVCWSDRNPRTSHLSLSAKPLNALTSFMKVLISHIMGLKERNQLSCSAHSSVIVLDSKQKNKIGLQGAEYLAELIPDMKNLKELYIQENQIGDTGLLAILKALENSTLVRLDLSSNGLCKTPAVGMECA